MGYNDGKAKKAFKKDLFMYDDVCPVQSSPTLPAPLHLFLFPGSGGYDPKLIKVGNACQEAANAIQITYRDWRFLRDARDFDFEALVTDAVEQIRQHRPARDIMLTGHSFGGLVAFAVATRLRDAGHTIRFLGLLDITAQPGLDVAPGALRAPKTKWQQLLGFLAALRQGEAQSKLAYATARVLMRPPWNALLNLYARVPRRWLKGKFATYLDRDLRSQYMEPLRDQWVAHFKALQPLPVPIYLFRTSQHGANVPNHLGWDRCCPDLTVVSVPGKHLSMFARSNLPVLCAAFQKAVHQVFGRTA